MKMTGKRIFTAITLVLGFISLYQVLSKPEPVANPKTPEIARANAQSFDQKLAELQAPRAEGSDPTEVHFSSDEVSAELSQSMGATPAPAPAAKQCDSSLSRFDHRSRRSSG